MAILLKVSTLLAFMSSLCAMETLNDTSQEGTKFSRDEYSSHSKVVERVVGLGGWCLTKAQINGYFAPMDPINISKKGHGDLFDWMFIYDYKLFTDALEHKLDDFFEKDDLKIIYGNELYNTKNHMRWNHITQNHDPLLSETVQNDKLLTEYFPTIKNKLNYLKDRFISAKSYNTLYIISLPPYFNPLTLENLISVRNGLTTIREGDNNFTLLMVTHFKTFDGVDNIIVREAEMLGESWNEGDSQRWKDILDEFKYKEGIWD